MSAKFNNPNINVNNTLIKYKPGSVEYKLGIGETKSEPYTTGAGRVVTSHSVDVSTKKGYVKFILEPNEDSKELIELWSQIGGAIVIDMSEELNGELTNVTYGNMALMNEPTFQAKPDGEVDVEFDGDPAR